MTRPAHLTTARQSALATADGTPAVRSERTRQTAVPPAGLPTPVRRFAPATAGGAPSARTTRIAAAAPAPTIPAAAA